MCITAANRGLYSIANATYLEELILLDDTVVEYDGNLTRNKVVQEIDGHTKEEGDNTREEVEVEGPVVVGTEKHRSLNLVVEWNFHYRIVYDNKSIAEIGQDHDEASVDGEDGTKLDDKDVE